MPKANATYVCPPCRTAKRAQATGGLITNYRCSLCGNPLAELHPKWRVPDKSDNKGWREVQAVLLKSYQQWTPRRTQIGLDKIKKIDGAIVALENQSATSAKIKQLKKLRFERRTKKKEYNLEGAV